MCTYPRGHSGFNSTETANQQDMVVKWFVIHYYTAHMMPSVDLLIMNGNVAK